VSVPSAEIRLPATASPQMMNELMKNEPKVWLG